MIHSRNRSARKVPLRRLSKDRRGGVLVYTALVGFVVIGISALAVDLGSVVTTHTEIQSYGDAASLACATQLTGNNGAIARATAAAQDSLVQNDQTFLVGSDTITITAFWTDAPQNFMAGNPTSTGPGRVGQERNSDA